MEITKESVREFWHGHTDVDMTRKRLTELDFLSNKGVLLRCPGTDEDPTNSEPVYVGGNGVTADSSPGTGGLPIMPGDAIFIPIDKPMLLWVVSSADDQDIAWMAI